MATWLDEKHLLEVTGSPKALTQNQEQQLLEIKVVSLEFKKVAVFSIHHQQAKKIMPDYVVRIITVISQTLKPPSIGI